MTALDPAQRELQRFARARAGRIRDGMRNYIATLGEIYAAWNDADWTVLGYRSWQEYVDTEFGAERVRLPADQRKKAVEELRLSGMSTRAIGQTLGVNRSTVQKDLQVGGIHPPEEVIGADGKRYRSPLAEAVEQAIVEATDRAEDHRESPPGDGAGTWVDTPAPSPEVAASGEEATASSPVSSGDPRPASSPPAGRGSLPDDLVDSPVGPISKKVADVLDKHVPDPDPHAEWRLGYLKRIHAVHAVIRSKPADVAAMADVTCFDELNRCVDALNAYHREVLTALDAALPDNVKPLRRSS
jgi:hypothetical protein